MRADAPTGIRNLLASIVMASACAAATISAGCRTGGVGAPSDPDRTLKAVDASAEAAEIAALPDGLGKSLVTERCLLCHGPALITQQRKDAAAWGRTVTQMRTWGTPIQDPDQATLVAYLAEHFGPLGARR